MSISLYVFLVIYIALVVVAGFLTLVNLYHILRFGHYDRQSYFMTGIFIAGLILISFVSFVAIIDIDWSTSIVLFSDGGGSSIPTSTPGTQF